MSSVSSNTRSELRRGARPIALRLQAPAKLNLYLRVVAKRPDGYHEIETLYERLDLCDELTIEPCPHGLTLSCTDPALPTDDANLVLQAARKLQEAGRVREGAAFHLIKRIPVAAGLGGGSSDAAAALQGLNAVWKLGWGAAKLAEVAAGIGSDVAFFLVPQPFAIGRGRGERCTPVAGAPLAHVLVVPEERLSTREVYAGTRLPLTPSRASITILQHALRNGSLSELAEGLWNDLEPEAIRRCPLIVTIRTRLRDLDCLGAGMSGSGTAVFGLCRDLPHAREVATQLRAEAPAWQVEVVQTGSTSPVVLPGC